METGAVTNNLKVEVNNKQVLSIALPITLAILIPQINLLVNSIFLGRIGEDALGNAGITGVFYLIFAVAGNGLNNAMQTVFSKHAGADDSGAFKTILTQGIRISLQFAFVCILFTWLVAPFIMKAAANDTSYLVMMNFLRIRIFGLPFLFLFQMGNAFLVASLNSRYLMIAAICEALLNILLDYMLIFGKFGLPALGFNGAAIASVLSEVAGFIVVLLVLHFSGLKKKYGLLQHGRYDKVISKEIKKVALPLVVQYIISVSTWLIFFLLIETRGTIAKAISNIMRNVFGLAGVFVWAFASTSNTMVGNLMGQKREDMVLPAIYRIAAWSFSFAFCLCGILNLFPEMFFRLFGQDESFVQQGVPVIRMVSLGILFLSISNIFLNGVTGTGKTRVNLAIEIIAISLYLSYTWYFMKVHYVSLAVAWSNEFVYWTIIFIMSFLFLKSGKWKTKVNRPAL